MIVDVASLLKQRYLRAPPSWPDCSPLPATVWILSRCLVGSCSARKLACSSDADSSSKARRASADQAACRAALLCDVADRERRRHRDGLETARAFRNHDDVARLHPRAAGRREGGRTQHRPTAREGARQPNGDRGAYGLKKPAKTGKIWSGRRESNPRLLLGRQGHYHYATPALVFSCRKECGPGWIRTTVSPSRAGFTARCH